MPELNQPHVARTVGSERADFIGHRLMLDVHEQMRDQPDHWVLVSALARRTTVPALDLAPAIFAVALRGWLESDVTFNGQKRVRLTAEGRALLGSTKQRMHATERPRMAPRHVRRRLPSRQL